MKAVANFCMIVIFITLAISGIAQNQNTIIKTQAMEMAKALQKKIFSPLLNTCIQKLLRWLVARQN